jgi:hypothetical protein
VHPSWTTLTAGFAAMRRARGPFVRLGVLTFVVVVGLYLVVTLGNSALFHYDFFNEDAPSSTADTVAVVSLLVLGALEVVVATVLFGAFCAVGLGSSCRASLRASLRALKRDGWWAVPAFCATAAALVLVAPGLVMVGPLSAIAVARVAGYPHSVDYVRRVWATQQLVGLLATMLALAIVVGVVIVGALPTTPSVVAITLIIVAVISSIAMIAWTAACSAVVYLDYLKQPRTPS